MDTCHFQDRQLNFQQTLDFGMYHNLMMIYYFSESGQNFLGFAHNPPPSPVPGGRGSSHHLFPGFSVWNNQNTCMLKGKTKADTGSAARGEAPRCRAPTFAESCTTTKQRTKEWFIGMVYVSDDNSAHKLVRNIDVTSLLKSTKTQCKPTELKLCYGIVVLRSRRCPQCVEHTHSSDDRERHPEA